MSTQPNLSYEYQVGGALEVDAPSYVVRQADDDLYNALKAGKFCYVLNSRQMGKSSLRVQTRRRLEKENVACASIDLTGIGSEDATSDKWYTGIIYELNSNFSLEIDLRTWLREHKEFNPVHRLREFIEQVLLGSVRQDIVIFVDEIDSVLALNFGIDDFFAFLRFCYNQRAEQSEYRRLTFALLGVATPPDLIRDKNRTPFNIGHAIELNGFQFQEAQLLAQGLASKTSNPETVLREVLAWTGGQPFLTQKLCQLVLDAESLIVSGEERLWIENLVRSCIIENWESQDEPEHLRTIRNRLLRNEGNEQRIGKLLELYQQILQQREIPADGSDEQMELRLSGLVVQRQSKLEVYNRIYKEVFGQQWLKQELDDLRPPFYREALKAWFASDCQDKSQLLRGQVLEDARKWAEGKSLSNEDNQFLTASLDLERQEFAAALKPHNFKFKHGEAASSFDLISLCDNYPDEAEDYLFSKYLERWLFGRGKADLANLSRKIVASYQIEKRKGLEIFVREICKEQGQYAYPKIFFAPNELNLDEIPVGFQKRYSFKIDNKGRGFAWGDVTFDGYIPGLSVPDKFDSSDGTFNIELDTLEVQLGNYYGFLVIDLEGISEPCRIPLSYTVRELQVRIEPSELNLGVISHDGCPVPGSLRITCESAGARLKGTASTDMEHLQVTPNSFEGSSLEFSLSLDTASLEAGHYNAEISLKTNSGEFQVPVYFKKPLRWDIIAQISAGFGIPIGLCMYSIRLILANHLSVGLDDSWILSYPPEVSRASFFRLVYPLDLFGMPEVKSTCSIFGLILISFLSIILWSAFREHFEYFTEYIRPKLETLYNWFNWFSEFIENNIIRNNWNNRRLYSYQFYSQKRRFLINIITSKTTVFSFLFLLILLILGLFINWSVNIFAWIGASFILISDLTAYSFTWIGINQPAVGWLVLGCITGGALGLIQALKCIKQYSLLSKVCKSTVAIVLILLFNACLNGIIKTSIDPFPKLVLQEDFTSPSKTWSLPPGTAMKYGGLFRQEPRKKTNRYSLWYGHNFKDVDFSADAKKLRGSNDIGFGILTRYNSGNFYYLLINGDGQFAMGKHSKSKKMEDKIGWENSTAIKRGNNRNRLRIVCNGNRVIGWVNEQRVGVFEDDSYTSGQIGVISARGDSEAVAVYFDDVLAKEKPE